MTRPSAWLHNLGRGDNNRNNWLTDCKICRCGIYKGQPHLWLSDPLGLSHTECAERVAGQRDADAHRLAEVAHQLAQRVRLEEMDATARWLCGELDGLDRWRLLFMLAAMVPAEKTPGELLAWFWDLQRERVS